MVDSGADLSCFPLPLASALGIDLAQCTARPIGTAGGSATEYTWKDQLDCVFMGEAITLNASFAETSVALLGREDFFELFLVEFDQRSLTFNLTRTQPEAEDDEESGEETPPPETSAVD